MKDGCLGFAFRSGAELPQPFADSLIGTSSKKRTPELSLGLARRTHANGSHGLRDPSFDHFGLDIPVPTMGLLDQLEQPLPVLFALVGHGFHGLLSLTPAHPGDARRYGRPRPSLSRQIRAERHTWIGRRDTSRLAWTSRARRGARCRRAPVPGQLRTHQNPCRG